MGAILGGQVGLVGHLDIGDGARLGAQSGVMHDIPAGETHSGYPAVPHKRLAAGRSPRPARCRSCTKRIRELEKAVKKLQEEE